MVFYESPYRLLKTLQQFAEVFGPDRQACVCREISKMFEESVRGTLQELISHFEAEAPRGEIVVVVGGASRQEQKEKAREERRAARKSKNKNRDNEMTEDE